MHKHLRGPAAKYEGYPALLKYSGYYNGKTVPGVETLREREQTLERYIGAKKLELDAIARIKQKAKDELGTCPHVDATIRMCFRRAEIQLMHDIKELEAELEMVHNAAIAQMERERRY